MRTTEGPADPPAGSLAPSNLSHSVTGAGREQCLLELDEIARQGAKRMLAEALEAEVEAYIEAATDHRAEQRRALVVRNG